MTSFCHTVAERIEAEGSSNSTSSSSRSSSSGPTCAAAQLAGQNDLQGARLPYSPQRIVFKGTVLRGRTHPHANTLQGRLTGE